MNGDLNNIIECVNSICSVDIRSRNRSRNIVDAKKIYFYIATGIGVYSYEAIGVHVGKDHSSVHHHLKTIEFLLKSDPLLRKNLDACMHRVNNILGLKNFDYKERVMLNWKHLTIEQRQELADLCDNFCQKNKVNEPVYV